MTTQSIHVQALLHLIHALFALAALGVVVVLPLAVARVEDVVAIGDNQAEVGADAVTLGLGDHSSWVVPCIGLVVKAIEEPLLLVGLLVLVNRLVHQRLGELLQYGVGREAEG